MLTPRLSEAKRDRRKRCTKVGKGVNRFNVHFSYVSGETDKREYLNEIARREGGVERVRCAKQTSSIPLRNDPDLAWSSDGPR